MRGISLFYSLLLPFSWFFASNYTHLFSLLQSLSQTPHIHTRIHNTLCLFIWMSHSLSSRWGIGFWDLFLFTIPQTRPFTLSSGMWMALQIEGSGRFIWYIILFLSPQCLSVWSFGESVAEQSSSPPCRMPNSAPPSLQEKKRQPIRWFWERNGFLKKMLGGGKLCDVNEKESKNVCSESKEL